MEGRKEDENFWRCFWDFSCSEVLLKRSQQDSPAAERGRGEGGEAETRRRWHRKCSPWKTEKQTTKGTKKSVEVLSYPFSDIVKPMCKGSPWALQVCALQVRVVVISKCLAARCELIHGPSAPDETFFFKKYKIETFS